MASQITEVLTIPQVAQRARWKRKRMWRHLIAANRELGGLLLVNMGRTGGRPRWVVTLAALKALHPQWFFDPESMQARIDVLEEEVETLRQELAATDSVQRVHTRAIADFKKAG